MKNRSATLTGQVVGQTPWSARDALVPQPEQRYQHHVNASRPTGASAADQGSAPQFVQMFSGGKTKWHWVGNRRGAAIGKSRQAGYHPALISLIRLRDEGVPRGPGGPPSNLRPSPAVA